jgi:hypothetical protein
MYGGLHSPRTLPSEDALLRLARGFTPRVEAHGPALVLLDLHGLGRAWPTPGELGRALLDAARTRALETQVALAFTRTVCLVLCRACPGVTVVPAGREAAALAPLPLALLSLAPEREELLLRWGLRTIGDLQRLPPHAAEPEVTRPGDSERKKRPLQPLPPKFAPIAHNALMIISAVID